MAHRVLNSKFLEYLEQEGYILEYFQVNDEEFAFRKYGEYLYDQIILISSILGKKVTKTGLINFFDSGRNVFIATDIDADRSIRGLFNEFGYQIDELGSEVKDNFESTNVQNNQFLAKNIIKQDIVTSEKQIMYKGIGIQFSPYDSNYQFSIVQGNPTTYGYNEAKEDVTILGSNIILVGAAQGRNNARAVLTGSLEIFNNKNMKYNRAFMKQILNWNFGLAGQLRVNNITHHIKDQQKQEYSYKIKEHLTFEADIEIFNQEEDRWIPYITDDIQFEFVMLDPYYRHNLEFNKGIGKYQHTFKIPDQHGIYHIQIKYFKPGYQFLTYKEKVIARPWNHNEFDQFYTTAFPYCSSVMLSIIGFIVFILYLLFDHEKSKIKQE